MKRTKAGGSSDGGSSGDASMDAARNMSYTNLAAMASGFETYQRVVPAGTTREGAGGNPEKLHAQAMENVNAGLKLDQTNTMQAIELYQKGADLLSQALEARHGDSTPQPSVQEPANQSTPLTPLRMGTDGYYPSCSRSPLPTTTATRCSARSTWWRNACGW